MMLQLVCFFFNDTATTEIYTLSLHDALPISHDLRRGAARRHARARPRGPAAGDLGRLELELAQGLADRKSTRLNSSHANISYAVFCLKKKNSEPHTAPTLHVSRSLAWSYPKS